MDERGASVSVEMQRLLGEKALTKYKLSQISGVPKTTIMDICSDKSKLEQCSARTVYLLAKALGCSMESLLDIADCKYLFKKIDNLTLLMYNEDGDEK